MTTPDVLIIGAGALGAATAWFATRAGLSVEVVEQGQVASGTTSSCEGNLLVSDKEAGPELDLALLSLAAWREELGEHGSLWEFEQKGGLVVSSTVDSAAGLAQLAERQRIAGVEVLDLAPEAIPDYEPHLTRELSGAAFYPQDCQVQPMLVAAHLLRMARERGAEVRTGTRVVGFLRDGDRILGVRTDRGDRYGGCVVNAAGTWAGEVAALAGVEVPILPRRGFILVTQPLPPTVFHKVYAGEYVASTQSSGEGLQTSTVVEGTQAGTILIGSSRERVGFDRSVSPRALREIAAKALVLYPSLSRAKVMRSYLGFRPYCPDHLPVIGPDPRAPGLWHAAGHEGAGIGLSAGTAKILVQALLGEATDLDISPFAPERFAMMEAS
ncbi:MULTISPECIES: NAD(P)/FAD-dependent oxidoreductase [Amycolatopsis]|uniref:NAD(P)/FAD-dependent oxidoreductase n=1 Tax=Amycolatopsis albidoflavus TaxID=102226 RepID=A0ABW5IBJ9_9PSEU